MRLILFTGPPASGKSSVAHYVASKEKIILTAKDDWKITLFEKYGFKNHDEKKTLSRLSEIRMYEDIEIAINHDRDILVDNNFKHFGKIKEIIEKNRHKNIIIKCVQFKADYSILAERYNNRIFKGDRHPALYTLNQYPIIDGISVFHPQITEYDVRRIQSEVTENSFGDAVIEVNTNFIEDEFHEICERILKFIAKVEI